MIRNVLLVDYDPRSVRRIRALLQQDGIQTLLATNGDAGVNAFRVCHPDLVVVQDLIPGRHGFEVCRAIKAEGNGTAPPVLLLFSPRPGRRGAARSSGCDAILDKPFDDPSFLAMVRRLLPAPPPETIPVEAAVVDAPDPEIEVALEQLFREREPEESVEPPPAPRRRAKRKRGGTTAERSRRSKGRKAKPGSDAAVDEPVP